MNSFGFAFLLSLNHSSDWRKKSTSLNFLPLPFENTSIGCNSKTKFPFGAQADRLKALVAKMFLK